jgi:hypothetical protein
LRLLRAHQHRDADQTGDHHRNRNFEHGPNPDCAPGRPQTETEAVGARIQRNFRVFSVAGHDSVGTELLR